MILIILAVGFKKIRLFANIYFTMTYFSKKNALIVLYIMAFFFVSCQSSFTKVSPKEFDGKFPDESAVNIELVFSDSGKTSFTIYAPILNKYYGDSAYMDCPKGVTIISYDEWGNKQSILTADYAINEERSLRMEARNNVIITDLKKNESILSEQIIWDKRTKRIYSDVEVCQINSDGTKNYGDGFDADERFTQYTVRRPRGEMLTSKF